MAMGLMTVSRLLFHISGFTQNKANRSSSNPPQNCLTEESTLAVRLISYYDEENNVLNCRLCDFGGWVLQPELNISAFTVARPRKQSRAWDTSLGRRNQGSLYATAVREALIKMVRNEPTNATTISHKLIKSVNSHQINLCPIFLPFIDIVS